MTTAWQIIVNGHGRCVVASLDRAFEHVARHLWSDGDPGAEFTGSLRHRIRYEVESRGFESYELVEHDLLARPGHETTIAAYDLVNAFDPSYLVQKHLHHATVGAEDSAKIAMDLEREAFEGVARIARGNAERRREAVEDMRRWQRELDGPQVVPRTGSADAILRDLPGTARGRFEWFAAKIFPQTAAPGVRR